MAEKYATRLGFDKIPDWRFQTLYAKCANIDPYRLISDSHLDIKELREVDWSKVHDYDQKFVHTLDRRRYIEAFLTQKESYTKVSAAKRGVVRNAAV